MRAHTCAPASHGNNDVLRRLLSLGGDASKATKSWNKGILHVTVDSCPGGTGTEVAKEKLLSVLVTALRAPNVDVNLKDRLRETPLSLAKRRECDQSIIDLLVAAGGVEK